jgi:hypothetical protein
MQGSSGCLYNVRKMSQHVPSNSDEGSATGVLYFTHVLYYVGLGGL